MSSHQSPAFSQQIFRHRLSMHAASQQLLDGDVRGPHQRVTLGNLPGKHTWEMVGIPSPDGVMDWPGWWNLETMVLTYVNQQFQDLHCGLSVYPTLPISGHMWLMFFCHKNYDFLQRLVGNARNDWLHHWNLRKNPMSSYLYRVEDHIASHYLLVKLMCLIVTVNNLNVCFKNVTRGLRISSLYPNKTSSESPSESLQIPSRIQRSQNLSESSLNPPIS